MEPFWLRMLVGLAGWSTLLYFATRPDAASVLSLGTAGPGYYPAFLDPAGRRPIPTGARPAFFAGFLLLHLLLIGARAFWLGRTTRLKAWTGSVRALSSAGGAFLPLFLTIWLPLYADRILLVASCMLYFAFVLPAFASVARAAIEFARGHWTAFALIVIAVAALAQLYLFAAADDYVAFLLENKLAGKYKRNALRGGLVLIAIGLGLYSLLAIRAKRQRVLPAYLRGNCAGLLRVLRHRLRPPEAANARLWSPAHILFIALAMALLSLLTRPFFEYHYSILAVGMTTAIALLIIRLLQHAFVPSSAGDGRHPPGRRAGRIAVALVALMLLAWSLPLGLGAIDRFHAFLPLNLDMTVEHQALWTLSFHGYPFLSIGAKDGIYDRIYWPDHVPFFYYALAPLYRLAPRVETLLWLQTIFLALGALPVFALTRRLTRRFPDSWSLATLGGLLYLLHPGFQLLSQWDVHEGAFAVPLFLGALYFYEAGRKKLFLFFMLLGGCVREEMGLFGVSVGLMLLLSRRDIRYGGWTLLMGAAQFVIMSKVMQAYFGGLGHYERYAPLFYLDGEYNVQNILYLLLFNPIFFLREWWAAEKLSFVLITLLPLGFLPLVGMARRRWPLLLAGLASTLLATRLPNFTPGYQYSILLLVAGFYFLPHGLRLLLGSPGRTTTGARRALVGGLLFCGIMGSVLYGTLIGKTHAISFMGEWNPDRGEYEWNGWIARSRTPARPTATQDELRALLRHVPDRAAVAAPERISTHLSGRGRNYTLPRIDDDTEYVVIHRHFASNPTFDAMLKDERFAVWKHSPDGASIILKRK